MRKGMFDAWPEFMCDIPVFDSMPGPMPSTRSSRQLALAKWSQPFDVLDMISERGNTEELAANEDGPGVEHNDLQMPIITLPDDGSIDDMQPYNDLNDLMFPSDLVE